MTVLIRQTVNRNLYGTAPILSGQFIINPYPNLRPFWEDSLTKPPFGVTSAEVVINWPDTVKDAQPMAIPFVFGDYICLEGKILLLLLMLQKSGEVGSWNPIIYYGFGIDPRWCKISAINSRINGPGTGYIYLHFVEPRKKRKTVFTFHSIKGILATPPPKLPPPGIRG